MMEIVVFEDDRCAQFEPLVLAKPVFDLRLGSISLLGQFEHVALKGLFCRETLKNSVVETYPQYRVNALDLSVPCFYINARLVLEIPFSKWLERFSFDHSFVVSFHGQIAALFLTEKVMNASQLFGLKLEAVNEPVVSLEKATLVEYPWELLEKGLALLPSQIQKLTSELVFIHSSAVIEPGVHIDSTHGSVWVGENVKIEAGSRLEGPLFIDSGAQILGARLKNCVVGAFCKIGGEVSSTIFSSYSNKAHYGYVGNSYVGEWVNLGAGTTTSNLKNTYGEISVQMRDKKIKTGAVFFGSIISDHVKTGIGTLLNTGTVLGFSAHVWGAGVHSGYIHSFSWGESGCYESMRLDKFFEVSGAMMARRGQKMKRYQQILVEAAYMKELSFRV